MRVENISAKTNATGRAFKFAPAASFIPLINSLKYEVGLLITTPFLISLYNFSWKFEFFHILISH